MCNPHGLGRRDTGELFATGAKDITKTKEETVLAVPTLQQLATHLWLAAEILRRAMDAGYKQYTRRCTCCSCGSPANPVGSIADVGTKS